MTTNTSTSQSSFGPAPDRSNALSAYIPLAGRRQGRREFRARLVRAGRITRADGSPGPFTLPADTLQRAVSLGQFDGLAVFADHPGFFESPSVKALIAVTHSADWNDATQGVDATIRFYTDAGDDGSVLARAIVAILDMIEDDTEEGIDPPNLGVSLVFWPIWQEGDDRPRILAGFNKIESADIVFSPAADGRILEALSTAESSQSSFGPSANKEKSPMTEERRIYHAAASALSNCSGIAAVTDETTTAEPEPAEQPARESVRADLCVRPSTLRDAETSEIPEKAAEARAQSWDRALMAAYAPRLIQSADLPAPSRARLGARSWANPEDLSAAIEEETAYLAQLEEQQVIQLGGRPPRASGARDSLDRITLAVEALVTGRRPPDGVQPLTGIRELYLLLSGDYEMRGVFNADRVMFANVNTTTMAGLTANALNKVVVNMFGLYPQWWAPIVTEVNFSTLHDARWTTLGGVGDLPTVGEGAAYTELAWDDQTETDSFVKKGGYLGLTLEAIDKDDTGRLLAAPRALAQAAWLTLAKSISAIFTSNSGTGPSMSDSNNLFDSSNHSNLGTSALSFAAWDATRVAMRKQTDLNSGERLGALTAPRYLLVPPDLEVVALQVMGSALEPATADNDINPFAEGEGRAALLASARERVIVIDLWTDTNNWAAVANPMLYPSIGLGYRYGRVPEIFSVASPTAGLMFTNDTLPVKVRFFYAVGPTDWRGLYKHNVS